MKASKLLSGLFIAALLASVASGCKYSDDDQNDTQVQGECTQQDASTDHAGQPKEPSKPKAQPIEVSITVAGKGALSGLKPECQLEGASGNFKGLLVGQGEIEDGGFYFAGLASSSGAFTTPSGSCEIPDLSVASVTEVVVKAKLENTSENCRSYCESKARAHAESECGASSTQASCRSAMEAEYTASCRQECTGTTTRRIVAETRLGLAAIAQMNAQGFTGKGLGSLDADLTFEKIEESNGEVID